MHFSYSTFLLKCSDFIIIIACVNLHFVRLKKVFQVYDAHSFQIAKKRSKIQKKFFENLDENFFCDKQDLFVYEIEKQIFFFYF